jgi:hypothetical protein
VRVDLGGPVCHNRPPFLGALVDVPPSRLPLRTLGLALPILGLLSISPYLLTLRSPNELCRLAQTRALVDFGTVEINQVLMMFGRVGDLSRVDDATGHHYYPSKAPLLSYLAVPVYAVLKALHGGDPRAVAELGLIYFSRLFCTVLPALLVLWPLRRFLEAHFDEATAAALLCAYGLGTIAFPYAELFMSHGLTGIVLFGVFYALWRHKRGEWGLGAYAVAGLLAGVSVATEYTAALALPPLAVYGLYVARGPRWKAAAVGVAAVLPLALFLGWYHWRCFGSPLETGYKHLNDPGYQGWHTRGFLGVSLPDLDALFLSFFSPLRGLFVISPFLVLSLPGFYWLRAKPEWKAERWVLLAIFALYAYFTSSFSYESWGWTTGPRHLTPLSAFLLLPCGVAIDRMRTSLAGQVTAGALLVLSIVNAGLLTQVNYISDCLRNGVHRLAWPLVVSGHLPHSPLSLLGVPNPWAWLPEAAALLGAMLLCAWVVSGGRREALTLSLVVALIGFQVHGLIPGGPNIKCEDDTYRDMARDWVPRPGEASHGLWSP